MEISPVGFVGRVPIRNIWLLMLYASDIYRIRGMGYYGVEENPDDIPDLIAELLVGTVERRLMRNLSAGYRMTDAITSRVRGRIDLLRTESHQLLRRAKVACHYEELTIDTPRNRYVRAALQRLTQIVRTDRIRIKCSALSARLTALGVTGPKPELIELSTETFGRNDVADKTMISLARLAFDLALPLESSGVYALNATEREERWLQKLFERAVGGFYSQALERSVWNVQCGKKLTWNIADKTSAIDDIMPSMKTDIFLENKASNNWIIIDTKFTDIVTSGWYREKSLKSGYVYQIYAYLRSQENQDIPPSMNSTGILLHPVIDTIYDEAIILDGHRIRFMTVNLAGKATEIRSDLLKCVVLNTA
jgi:5-methylcytosine-specific restriction enzyme subunit McrC